MAENLAATAENLRQNIAAEVKTEKITRSKNLDNQQFITKTPFNLVAKKLPQKPVLTILRKRTIFGLSTGKGGD